MSLLKVKNVGKYYNGEPVFRQVTFDVNAGARIGVVGQNGQGKTTLLRLIAGELVPDEGEIEWFGTPSVKVMAQTIQFEAGQTAFDVAMEAFSSLCALEQRLRDLEEAITQADSEVERDQHLKKYGKMMTRFEDQGGYDMHARAREVLIGLGFSEHDLGRGVATFSGGEKVRLSLAKLLLVAPDLLLLDEPTNHLDLEAMEWLEDYLKAYAGTIMVISHDRYFMDHIVTEILEVHQGEVERYLTTYSGYLKARKERRRRRQRAYERQQQEVERIQSFIRRYHAGQRHKEAEDRRKKLERMVTLSPPPDYEGGMGLSFPVCHSGNDVILGEGLTITRPGLTICEGVDLRLQRGDRIALLGPNGAGKTTLLQVLLGLERPTAGSLRWGTGVVSAYFPQDLSFPDESVNLIQELRRSQPNLRNSTARDHLARFEFFGDDVFQPLSTLSGGERTRLHLAKMALVPSSLLVLDEPTNHLDLEARQDLERALLDYDGTAIFVTHDRYFVDQVATALWILDGGHLKPFSGNYSDYRAYRQAQQFEEQQARVRRRKAAPRPKRPKKKVRVTSEELDRLEQEIEEQEAKRDELAEFLSRPSSYAEGAGRDAVQDYQAVEDVLKTLYRRWENLAHHFEQQRNKS